MNPKSDWALSPAKSREIELELADHLACLMSERGAGIALSVKQNLERPAVRRKLSAPHLVDQLATTLHRFPNVAERGELLWLLAWFGLIMVSDTLALVANNAEERIATLPTYVSAGMAIDESSIWLMQGIARAGFFSSLAMSLWRAWSLGPGVALARILQLKLIHTLLVLTATLILGERLWESFEMFTGVPTIWPIWLTAPAVSAITVVLSVICWLLLHRRKPGILVGGVLLAAFLYSGGPHLVDVMTVVRPIVSKKEYLADGSIVIRTETDPKKILKAVQAREKKGKPFTIDELSSRQQVVTVNKTHFLPIHINSIDPHDYSLPYELVNRDRIVRPDERSLGKTSVIVSPISCAGAGLGWLAAPIPLLGLVGLLGMLIVMGRRSMLDALLYTVLCFVSIVTTIMPFVFAQEVHKIVALNAVGMVKSPFPGFESLLIGQNVLDGWLLMLGLLLSAGIPWLLTSLFLRPAAEQVPPGGAEIAQ